MSSKKKQRESVQVASSADECSSTDECRAPELVSLWNRCAECGSEADWSRLVLRLNGVIRLYLRECLADARDQSSEGIDDLAQELYCRLVDRDRKIMRRCRAELDAQVLAYLRTICRSVVVDDHRFRSAAKRAPAQWRLESEPTVTLDRMPAREPSPEQLLAAQELRTGLRHALKRIYPLHTQRNGWIFERAVFEGWTSREIARCVGLRPSSIDTVVHRTKQRLNLLGMAICQRS